MTQGHHLTGYCRQCTSNPCACRSGNLTDGERSLLAFADSTPPKKTKPKGSGKKEHGRAAKHGSVKMGRTGRYL